MTWLLYDGDCPFCANYVEFIRLRERFPDLTLVDLRAQPDHAASNLVRASGLKLDDGMALVSDDGAIHHGAEAIHRLAESGTVNGWLFGSRWRAKVLYPVLAAGRNATLKLLGRKKLGF